MNWLGMTFFVFVALIGLACAWMGYRLICKAVAADVAKGYRWGSVGAVLGGVFAAFGMTIISVVLWQCRPPASYADPPASDPGRAADEELLAASGELIITARDPVITINRPASKQETGLRESESDSASDDARWRPAEPALPYRQLVPIPEQRAPENMAHLRPRPEAAQKSYQMPSPILSSN